MSVFAVGADGSLTQVPGSPFATAGSESLAFSPDGRLLVTSNNGTNPIGLGGPGTVSVFAVGAGGALSQVSGSPFTTGGPVPASVAFSPDGGLLVTGEVAVDDQGLSLDAGTVTVFAVGAGGALTQVPGSPFAMTGGEPSSVAFSHNGGLLATADFDELPDVDPTPSANTVSVFGVGAGGTLTEVPGSPFMTTGGAAESVAFSPVAGLLATANSNTGHGVGVRSCGPNRVDHLPERRANLLGRAADPDELLVR